MKQIGTPDQKSNSLALVQLLLLNILITKDFPFERMERNHRRGIEGLFCKYSSNGDIEKKQN